MKRYYLVKDDERHEVEDHGDCVRFTETQQSISRAAFAKLGYFLEDQECREWVVCWDNSYPSLIVFKKGEKKYNWDNEVRAVEIREGERVLSREDIEMAWNSEPVQNHISFTSHESNFFRSLCKQLGFIEGDS